jgi:hypothetical protein
MQFVASWVDGVTGGVRGTLTALERVKTSADRADASLKKAAKPKPFDKKAFQVDTLNKRKAAGERDTALAELGLGLSRKERLEEAARRRQAAAEAREGKQREAEERRQGRERAQAQAREQRANDANTRREEGERRRQAAAEQRAESNRRRARDHVLGIRARHEAKEARDVQSKKKAEERETAKRERQGEAQKRNSFGGGFKSVFGGRLGGAALGAAAAAAMLGLLVKTVSAVKSLASEFTKFALGPIGLARANALIAQAQFRFQRMFVGINTRPALDALGRFLSVFHQQTTAGKAIAATVQRWGNLWMKALGGAEPLVSQFVDGLIVGFLKAEAVIWKVISAFAPLVAFLTIAKNHILGNNAAFEAGKYAVYALAAGMALGAVAAAVLVAGVASLAATLLAPIALIAGLISISYRFGAVFRDTLRSGGSVVDALKLSLAELFGSFAAIPMIGGQFAKLAAQLRAGVDPKLAQKGGEDAGGALGEGMAKGILAQLPSVASAAKALVKVADGAVKTEAEIHSPSRLFARQGRFMAAGVAVGMMAGANDIQAAASDALVPSLGPLASRSVQLDARALGRQAAPGERKVEVNIYGDVYGVEDLEARIQRAIQEDNDAAAKELGTS